MFVKIVIVCLLVLAVVLVEYHRQKEIYHICDKNCSDNNTVKTCKLIGRSRYHQSFLYWECADGSHN